MSKKITWIKNEQGDLVGNVPQGAFTIKKEGRVSTLTASWDSGLRFTRSWSVECKYCAEQVLKQLEKQER